MDMTTDQFGRLTKKKQDYLKQVIADKNGVFAYGEDPREYKKARK